MSKLEERVGLVTYMLHAPPWPIPAMADTTKHCSFPLVPEAASGSYMALQLASNDGELVGAFKTIFPCCKTDST